MTEMFEALQPALGADALVLAGARNTPLPVR
jgi:hypothetical protein